MLHQNVAGHEVSIASHVQHKFFSERRYLYVVSPVNPHGAQTVRSYDTAIPVYEDGRYRFGVYGTHICSKLMLINSTGAVHFARQNDSPDVVSAAYFFSGSCCVPGGIVIQMQNNARMRETIILFPLRN